VQFNKSMLRGWWHKFGRSWEFIIYLLAVLYAFDYGGTYGAIAVFVCLIIFASVRLWRIRDNIMMSVRYAETHIYGKPLDKEMWKGEKKPKLKFVWRKKNDRKD